MWLCRHWDHYDHEDGRNTLMLLQMLAWLPAEGRGEQLFLPSELSVKEASAIMMDSTLEVPPGLSAFLGFAEELSLPASSHAEPEAEGTEVQEPIDLISLVDEIIPDVSTLAELMHISTTELPRMDWMEAAGSPPTPANAGERQTSGRHA